MIYMRKDIPAMARTRSIAALLLLAVPLVGCATANPELAAKHNATLYSVHQPVVQRSDYVINLATPGGGLSPTEAGRLRGWFEGLQIGYGDKISAEHANGYFDVATQRDVAAIAASYGLLLNDTAPVTAGTVQPGSMRVIVSRMSASVPSCPDWSYANLPGAAISTDSNYGCAFNSNLAAMIADPADLVLGQAGSTTDDAAATARGVKAYRARGGGK